MSQRTARLHSRQGERNVQEKGGVFEMRLTPTVGVELLGDADAGGVETITCRMMGSAEVGSSVGDPGLRWNENNQYVSDDV